MLSNKDITDFAILIQEIDHIQRKCIPLLKTNINDAIFAAKIQSSQETNSILGLTDYDLEENIPVEDNDEYWTNLKSKQELYLDCVNTLKNIYIVNISKNKFDFIVPTTLGDYKIHACVSYKEKKCIYPIIDDITFITADNKIYSIKKYMTKNEIDTIQNKINKENQFEIDLNEKEELTMDL